MRAILVILLSFLIASSASAKSYKKFKSGNWTGFTVFKDSGKFTACSILTRYVSGTLVSISVTPKNSWLIALKRKGGYPPNSKFATKLYVDSTFLHGGTAHSTKSGVVRLSIPGSKRVINALRRGRVLQLKTTNGKSAYKLTGTRRAINRLINCTIAHKGDFRGGTARKATGSDAFSAPRKEAFSSAGTSRVTNTATGSSGGATVPREKLLIFVTNFLARAGFTGFRILPSKKAGDVMWKLPDGSLGTLKAYHSSRGISLDRITGGVIGSLTTSCSGDFASGKRKTSIENGVEVRRLFASCNETKAPFEIQYSLVKMQNGDILKVSHLRMGKSREAMDPEQMHRTERALLRVVKQDPRVLR